MVEQSEIHAPEHRHKQIGCATRGGDVSRATEETAIALARQHGADLIFLYVADASFAQGLSSKLPGEVVQAEVRNIGELVLEQAKRRAKARGVHARTELREGQVADEIQRFVEKHKNMDLLVVGHLSEHLHEHLGPVLQDLSKRRLEVVVVESESAARRRG